MSDYWRQINDGMASVVGNAQQSLVQVISGRRGAGAGIIWGSQGLIITNAHVVRRNHPKVVLSDGKEISARVLGADTHNDLAALMVDANGLPAMPVGDSKKLRAGDVVIALGHPWGITGSVTTGIVVGAGEALSGMPGGERDLIAVSLHYRPGYSGGPLVDAQGRVVGINVMMAGPEVGLAIPAHVVEAFLAALDEEQRHEVPEPDTQPAPFEMRV